MKLAVLPFNAAEGAAPALGRQISNFSADIARASTGAEINAVSYLAQVQEEDGTTRSAFVNVAETLLEKEWIGQMFSQSNVDRVIDGLFTGTGGNYKLTVRVHDRQSMDAVLEETWSFGYDGVFEHLHKLVLLIAKQTEMPLSNELEASMEFGTDSAEAFLKFLEGYDAFVYVQQANGLVTSDFTTQTPIDLLFAAIELDKDFLAPFDTLVQFCRICGGFRVGTFDTLKDAMEKLSAIDPEDYKPVFALAEIYAGVGDQATSAALLEKAVALAPNEPALYTRLAIAQMGMGMPVNAERNLRKALEMEDDSKPSADHLANVLLQTNRAHEIPALWKSIIDANPQNSPASAKYAISLLSAGKVEEGEAAFEKALELDDNLVIKRYYAPYLVQKQDLDRAMDFYEDCLDHSPNDVDALLEYARTLSAAGRDFEVPRVLQQVLASNPDPNIRAQTLAWLIELEQPKRVESLQAAQTKMEEGDFQTALRELKPMRNWLADYWKLWLLLATGHAHEEEFIEAEEAARKLIELFPACEPAYSELANSLSRQGKQEEAYGVMRFAANSMPQSLPVHVNLALAAKRSGREDEARHLARQIREAVGPNPEIEPILAEIEG